MFEVLDIKLEEYQDINGLFPASPNSENPEMRNFWIRDNYYIYLAVDKETKEKMIKAFQNIVDYLKNLGKFDYKPTQDWMHIHPRYNKNLKEISGGWSWVQNDSVGNLLEILSDAEDLERAKLIVDYLENIKYWDCADYGFWEEGPKEVRSSSLAACIRGLENYCKKFRKTENTKSLKQLIEKGYESLYKILPNETKSRKYDLALLSLLWPKQIVSKNIKEKIIANVQLHLEKPLGVIRYEGDTWSGKNNKLRKGEEMAWPLGLIWLYLITGEKRYFVRVARIKQKLGTIPEGIIEGLPNCTPRLLWAEAMYKLATEKFERS